MDCIFCRIANKEIPSDIVYESDAVIAFRDLNPQAPTHILAIPKKHVDGMDSAGGGDDLQGILLAAAHIARSEGIARLGYRLVINQGQQGGQSVGHLHVHILGGRQMEWPPG